MSKKIPWGIAFAATLLLGDVAAAQVLSREPARGNLRYPTTVYAEVTLDGRKCPGRNKVWEIAGGSYTRGIDRKYRCVPRPRK